MTSPAVLPTEGHRPAPGEAEIWLLDAGADQATAAEKARHVLDAAERERAAAFLRPGDRATYVVAHVGLRLLLGAYLGVRPQDVVLGRAACPLCGQAHGRPVAEAAPPLHFSLSHTHDLAVCAFAGSQVGVDVEGAKARDTDELALLLHPGERSALRSVPGEQRDAAFLRCWVRKEAYLKGTGVGLGVPLDSVDVGIGPPFTSGGPGPDRLDGWALAPFPVPDGYDAAVALHLPSAAGTVRPRVRPLHLAEAI